MKIILTVFFILNGPFSKAFSASEEGSSLHGKWKFTKFIYQGQEHPPLNPNLQLYFEFYKTGTNRLWWYRSDERGFCERIGIYSYQEDKLTDEIVWVNPQNNFDCSKDPDMQMGRKSTTLVEILDYQLRIHMSLAGEPFIYIWEKKKTPHQQPVPLPGTQQSRH